MKENVYSSNSNVENSFTKNEEIFENLKINKEVENKENLSKKNSLKSENIKNDDSNNERNSCVSIASHDSDSSLPAIEIVKSEPIKIISNEEMIKPTNDTIFELIQLEKERRNRNNNNNNDNSNISNKVIKVIVIIIMIIKNIEKV